VDTAAGVEGRRLMHALQQPNLPAEDLPAPPLLANLPILPDRHAVVEQRLRYLHHGHHAEPSFSCIRTSTHVQQPDCITVRPLTVLEVPSMSHPLLAKVALLLFSEEAAGRALAA